MLERDYFNSNWPKSAPRLCSQNTVFIRKLADCIVVFSMQTWQEKKV